LTILWQGLSALADLHGRKPQIVHRDLKPGNILIWRRNPLHIKFADFGLSKEGTSLKTICGTRTYLAPEVARAASVPRKQREKYKSAVDLWSFGLIILKYAYGLPHPGYGEGVSWC